mgnify:CR=1 FL=1
MKKFFSLIAVLGILFFILIEFLGDNLIKNILENNISDSLNRDVTIEELNIDYLSGKASAKNITLLNKKFDGYLIVIYTILNTFLITSIALLFSSLPNTSAVNCLKRHSNSIPVLRSLECFTLCVRIGLFSIYYYICNISYINIFT